MNGEEDALDAAEIPPELADWSRTFLDVSERNFRALGYQLAADNLRRYRSGIGGQQDYTDEQIAAFSPFLDAEDINRTRFLSYTLPGRTARNLSLNEAIRNIPDGGNYEGEDHFIAPISPLSASTYLAFGRSSVRSDLSFRATRTGDFIDVEGDVVHGFGSNRGRGEPFDFNPGQLGSEHAQVMEALGEARPFTMQYDRRQSLSGRLRLEPNGALTLMQSHWGAIR